MGFIDERALFKECHGNLGCCDGGLVDVDFETTDSRCIGALVDARGDNFRASPALSLF